MFTHEIPALIKKEVNISPYRVYLMSVLAFKLGMTLLITSVLFALYFFGFKKQHCLFYQIYIVQLAENSNNITDIKQNYVFRPWHPGGYSLVW